MEIHKQIKNGPEAPAHARRLLDSLESDVGEPILTEACLVLSEIVADSYQRARSHDGLPLHLIVRTYQDRLRLEVIDHRSFDIGAKTYEGMVSSMRRLALVNRVAADWGPSADGGIWAEFDLSKPPD